MSNHVHLIAVPEKPESLRQAFLMEGIEEKENQRIRKHERTGRPLGDESFINRIENTANRILRKQKPGPKKK